MTKPKRKKKRKAQSPLEKFRNIKGPKRELLIAERKAKGLTQGQLAELVGCSTAMISHLESGRTKPGLELSMRLEQVLAVPFSNLFPDL
ncbi:helix-turn-helix transcriptional regulator [Lysinibacillus sp. LZ02]|uniref:helix-turn-helix transcriptional regulator n=1 Tax=Lysinibacillus sp. LZ02 TaxID=3420668 RepID=UPI003D36B5A7